MPLRVHCPTGCVIRMPNNRAGRIVRCPKCKSPIRLPSVTKSELASSIPFDCQATIARPRRSIEIDNGSELADESSTEPPESIGQSPNQASPSDPQSHGQTSRLPVPDLLKPVEKKHLAPRPLPRRDDPAGEARPTEQDAASLVLRSDSSVNVESPTVESSTSASAAGPQTNPSDGPVGPFMDPSSETESPEAWVDGEGVPIVVRSTDKTRSRSQPGGGATPNQNLTPRTASVAKKTERVHSADQQAVQTRPENPTEGRTLPKPRAIDRVELPKPETKITASQSSKAAGDLRRTKEPDSTSPLLIDLAPFAGEIDAPVSEKDWQQRLEKANSDRKMLARFFAVCLCVVAIVNMIPAFYHWYHWTQLTDSLPLPRWIYMLIFVGAVHLVYAIFLAQIPDWSALRAVALAMLAVAFVFGFISTGLLVGGGQGNLSSFFGIPFAMNRQACIWCVAMLCLATLMSYWGGKESSNWQRAENLLNEILSNPATQA